MLLSKRLYWLVRLPIGFVGRATGYILLMVLSGMMFFWLRWSVASIAGVAVAIAGMLLLGLGIGWLRGGRAGAKAFGGERFGRALHAVTVALLVLMSSGIGYALFPVRRAAGYALWLAGPPAVPMLIRIAAGNDSEVSFEIEDVLQRFGPKAATAAPWLASHARGDRVLVAIGPPAVAFIVPIANDSDPQRRRWALEMLGKIHGTSEGVPTLVRAFDDPKKEIYRTAEDSLMDLGADADLALMTLAPRLGAYDPLTASDQEANRVAVILRIAKHAGPAAATMIPDLLRVGPMAGGRNNRVDSGTCGTACDALAATGTAAVAPLRELLRKTDQNPTVLEASCDVLAAIGPSARDAAEVRPLLKHPERDVRLLAAKAVWRIEGDAETAVPVLLAGLDEKSPYPALTILRDMGPAASAALPAYLKMLNSDNADRQDQAIVLLGALGPAAAPAVDRLVELLGKCDSATAREPIAAALGKIGPAAKPALPAVLAAINALEKDPNDWTIPRRRLNMVNDAVELGGQVQPLVDYLPGAIDAAVKKNAGFTDFDREEKAIGAAAEKYPQQSRALLPSVDRAYRNKLILGGSHERLLYAIGGLPAWFRYSDGAWIAWIMIAMLVCLVIEVAIFGWGWRRRK